MGKQSQGHKTRASVHANQDGQLRPLISAVTEKHFGHKPLDGAVKIK